MCHLRTRLLIEIPPDIAAARVVDGPESSPGTRQKARSKGGSSLKRVLANRANSKHSTGPKTARGKQASRLNGLKHGLRAELPVLPGEDAEELQARLDIWIIEQDARTVLEKSLVEAAVIASWRLERFRRDEAGALIERMLQVKERADDRDAGQ